MLNSSSDTGFFDDFTDETVAAVATDEQPLSSDTAEQTGLSLIGEEETEETEKEESSDMDTGEEENSDMMQRGRRQLRCRRRGRRKIGRQ